MFKDLYFTITKPFLGISLLIILALNVFGLSLSLYRTFFWYDVVLHFMGGAWVAALVVSWPNFKNQFYNFKQKLIFTLLVVVVVGIAWEILEICVSGIVYLKYYAGSGVLRELNAGLTLDTAVDLAMDLLGGFSLGYLFIKFKFKD